MKEDINKELKKLTDEIANSAYEFYAETVMQEEVMRAALHIRRQYESYIAVGFTEKQAFDLTKIYLKHAMDYEY